jgi:hypothetical protein
VYSNLCKRSKIVASLKIAAVGVIWNIFVYFLRKVHVVGIIGKYSIKKGKTPLPSAHRIPHDGIYGLRKKKCVQRGLTLCNG